MIRGITFFEREVSLLTPEGPKRLGLPGKSELSGMLDGRVIVILNEDWTPAGSSTKFVQGSVVSLDLAAMQKDPAQLKPTVIFAPSATEFVQDVDTTRNHLLLTTLENVQGRAYVYNLDAKGNWARSKLDIPDNESVGLVTANSSDDHFFVSLTGFLTPSSLLLGNATGTALKPAKALPPQFDASRDVVEQFHAVSSDGTRVPYFVVHRKEMKYDGTNPTVLYAYGGFQVSLTPNYSATTGKLWLERGGVYVLANIRGGGEFGPAWHDAGLKTNRMRIYDDFAAVGRDLVTRKITSPRRLGIWGGSNGGLLMGVEMTQHPDMWHAVMIDVPLLDMLGFEHIAAGASWVGEYGTRREPRAARLPRIHISLQPAQGRRNLPRTADLYDHQG